MLSKIAIRNYISLYSCLNQTHYVCIPTDNKISIRSEEKNQGSSNIITVKTKSFEMTEVISHSTEGNIIFKTVLRNSFVKRNSLALKQFSVHYMRAIVIQ